MPVPASNLLESSEQETIKSSIDYVIRSGIDLIPEMGLESLWKTVDQFFLSCMEKDPVGTVVALLPAVGNGASFSVRDVLFALHCRIAESWLETLDGQGMVEKVAEDTFRLVKLRKLGLGQ